MGSEARVFVVVACQARVEPRLPLRLVEHQVDGPRRARVLVVDVGQFAVGTGETRRPVADVAVHQQHLAAVLQELVEEVPDADLLPGHRLLVEVGKEALGLVQYDHVVSEVEAGAAQDVVAPLEDVQQAFELGDEARGVPRPTGPRRSPGSS